MIYNGTQNIKMFLFSQIYNMQDSKEFQEFYTRVVLMKTDAINYNSLIGQMVKVQVDTAYSIGKSIAVLQEDQVIGHLIAQVAKRILRFLKNRHVVQAELYDECNGWRNWPCYSKQSFSYELGICIKVYFDDNGKYDATLLLHHILQNRLNSFPGVTLTNCPLSLSYLAFPGRQQL
jgi:hypothetical protein